MIESTFLQKLILIKKCIKRVWYFPLLVLLDKGVTFQPYVCNGCHDVLMISMKLRNIAILKTYGVNYRCIIAGISKSEAISLRQKADLKAKTRTL